MLGEPGPNVVEKPDFAIMQIDWRKDLVVVDGHRMTIAEAKRRGFIKPDGSTETKAGQVVLSSC